MISSTNLNIASLTSSTTAQNGIVATEKIASSMSNEVTSSNKEASSIKISTLATQLAASASRAETRDKTLSHSQLAEKASSLLNQILGDSYQANKANYNSEVPQTDNPELLARAKQATEFVTSSDIGSRSVRNPFAGLSQEQLSNIIYDDSGTYTINERRAAYYESYDLEEAWREKVIAQMDFEYESTGKMTNFFKSVLEHYKELPAIEQALYPADYAIDLAHKIQLDFNYRAHLAEGKGKTLMSLFEMLFPKKSDQSEQLFQEKNTIDSSTVPKNKE